MNVHDPGSTSAVPNENTHNMGIDEKDVVISLVGISGNSTKTRKNAKSAQSNQVIGNRSSSTDSDTDNSKLIHNYHAAQTSTNARQSRSNILYRHGNDHASSISKNSLGIPPNLR